MGTTEKMDTKRVMGVSAFAVTTASLTSAAYQAAAEAKDRRRQRPPGRLVDAGGHRLHITRAGGGSPSVVIITALGASCLEWLDVQQRLAQKTAVYVYDRSGIGWSDPPPTRRTGKRMAGELHTLLHNASVAPPYVLVGHSLGGLVTRIFAYLYPAEIAGIALIDSSHPEQPWRLPKTELAQHRGGTLLQAARWLVKPLGLQRMAWDLGLRKTGPGWSTHRRASVAELLGFNGICKEVCKLGDLGDVPLTVLTSAELDSTYSARAQRGRARFYPAWTILQDELAALSSNSAHVTADYGGHHLNQQNPKLVAEVVERLVDKVRPSAATDGG